MTEDWRVRALNAEAKAKWQERMLEAMRHEIAALLAEIKELREKDLTND